MVFHPALCARTPFLNAILEYTDGSGWDAPIHVGDRLEVYDRGFDDVLVVEMVDGQPLVELAPGGQRVQLDEEDYPFIIASPFADAIWERHQKEGTPDGVAWGDGVVSEALTGRLMAGFDALCAEDADYHPGSNGTVRDLVHPSLYPYVHGVSAVAEGVTVPEHFAAVGGDPGPPDRWGRPFEASTYQWLPTDVVVDADGAARFDGYVNNLGSEHGEVVGALEELLSTALPLLESVYGYAQAYDPWDEREEDCEADLPEPPSKRPAPEPVKAASLRGRRLQVIPKLVQYEIGADASYESVWHVEGMSQEHIVATAVFVLDRDEELDGGALRFKRGYTREDAGQVFWNINQVRPRPVDEMVGRSMVPLGTVETPKGRLVVFPNSHVHRLTPMTTTAEQARRRIVVFWLVDPDVRILGTNDVPRQQGVMDHEAALAHRLALMEERRTHKQSHNVREISLCEH